jgi:Mg2+/Co2+ transporter CorB
MTETIKSDVGPQSANKGSTRTTTRTRGLKSQLLGGVITLLAGSGLVGVANLAYNVVAARLLGPTGFANATAVYTLLMLLSCITLAFQVVCAKCFCRGTAECFR